jgi:hypothetical protein
MANFGVFPLSTAILNGQAVTTTGTSPNLTFPLGQSYRLTLELLTASSTTTNFNLSLFTSSDGGTTYHGFLSFASQTTSGVGQSALIRPYLGVGDVATVINAPILGSTDYSSNTNVAVIANGGFDPRFIKARWQVATAGTVTFNLKLDVVAQDYSD